MPHFVTTTVVTPDRIDDFLALRTDVLLERLERPERVERVEPVDPAPDGEGTDGTEPAAEGDGLDAAALLARDGQVAYVLGHGPFRRYRRVLRVAPAEPPARPTDGDDALVVEDAEPVELVEITQELDYSLAVPIWGFLFSRPVQGVLRGPNRPVRPWWLPPDQLGAGAAATLSLLCVFAALAGYLGTLLTQTNTFFKEEFGVTDGQVGTMLAAVRIGALLALVIAAAADRRGRRQVLLWSAVAGCLVTATGALAPNLAVLGVSQTVARSFSTALALVISIIAVEEMPAGSRAFAVSVLSATGALGAGFAVMLVTVAGFGPAAWRILYLVPLAFVPIAVRLGRRIPETRRFTIADGGPDVGPDRGRDGGPARAADVGPHDGAGRVPGDRPVSRPPLRRWRLPAGIDRGRLLLLSVSGLAFSLFVLPASSFLNEYLRTERGFSAGAITVFQILTNTPGGIGIVVGGKLADRRGRRLIGAVGVGAGVVFTVGMYFVAGWPLWACSLLATLIGAMAVPALGVYGPELFPTAARGAANGTINLASVIGSAVGLLLAGRLSDHFGSLGPAMAVLSIGGIVVVLLVLICYPETASLELEDINPHDAPLARELLAFEGLDPEFQVDRFPLGADEGLASPPSPTGSHDDRDPEDGGRDR